MSRINSANKKKALTLRKEKLFEEIKKYEKLIEEAKLNQINRIEYEESSDSDTDLPILNIEPSLINLKIEHSAIQTCFEATQELTGLQILQSEVNILTEDPKYDGEPMVIEEGIWKEVTVECKVDLVPFSMTFYVHQPSRRFGGLSYRGLKTTVLKKPHEAELNKTILHELKTPSDPFEVLKEFSSAHRSRRTTLAELAALYSSALHMAPLADGGYQIKCGNLLEISWTLQNKSSPIAPFHHRMKFDLEYMDEAHIQTVMAAHKALSNPTINMDERTSLLSKIITVCLEVQGINLPESNSESETAPSKLDFPIKRKREEETMGPPKSLPKKSRPKSKENKEENHLNRKSNMSNRGSGAESVNESSNSAKNSVDTIVKSNDGNIAKKTDTDKKFKIAMNGAKNRDVVKEVSESNRKVSAKNSAKASVVNKIIETSRENDERIPKKDGENKEKKKSNNALENRAKDGVAKEVTEPGKKVSNTEAKESDKKDIEGVKKVSDVKDKSKLDNVMERSCGMMDTDIQNIKKIKKASSEVIGSKVNDKEETKDTNPKVVKSIDSRLNEKQNEKIHTLKKSKNSDGEVVKKNIEQTVEKRSNVPQTKFKNNDEDLIKRNIEQIVEKGANEPQKKSKNNDGELIKKNIEQTVERRANEPRKISKNSDLELIKKNMVQTVEKTNPKKKSKNNDGEQITKNTEQIVGKTTNEPKRKSKNNGGELIKKNIEQTVEKTTNELKQKSKNNDGELVKKNTEQTVDKTTNEPKKKPKNNTAELIKKNIEQDVEKNTNEHYSSKENPRDKENKITNIVKENGKKAMKEQNTETRKDSVERQKNFKPITNLKPINSTSDMKSKLLKNQFSDRGSRDMTNIILKKNTKIPQKGPAAHKIVKKNPLRVSPRKSISKLKGISPKVRKPLTHIPRLVTKRPVK